MRNRGRETEEGDLDVPAQQIVDGGAAAAIRRIQIILAGDANQREQGLAASVGQGGANC